MYTEVRVASDKTMQHDTYQNTHDYRVNEGELEIYTEDDEGVILIATYAVGGWLSVARRLEGSETWSELAKREDEKENEPHDEERSYALPDMSPYGIPKIPHIGGVLKNLTPRP